MTMWREFVEFAEKRHEPFSAICARFGISRKTGYKWLNRFRVKGEAGLVEQSRRPKNLPRKTPEAVEELAIALRAENPDWSAVRICSEMEARGIAPVPAPSTVDLILRRRREVVAQQIAESGAHSDAVRYEPNFRWRLQLHAEIRIAGSGSMVPAWVEDEVSRFVVGAFLIPPVRKEENLRAGVESLMRRHGMPWRMALASPREHTPFTVWLMRLGIGVDFCDVQPANLSREQSQLMARLADMPAYQRPAVERQMRLDPMSGLSGKRYANEKAVLNALEQARTRHNFGQTQESLQLRAPISLYRPSLREVPDEFAEFAYSADAETRVVSEKGIFTFQRKLVHVGRVFSGLEVEIKPLCGENRFVVVLGTQALGQVDLSAVEMDDTTSVPLANFALPDR
ncbi:MAG: helix-turn-helix domain-containing protein [Opitutaceae bacterium]|nr:helix-turn-helix domain-containing protein [Opitutaceae bacterium]